MPADDHILRKQLVEFVRGEGAHISLKEAVKDFPAKHYGAKPNGAPHSAWQQLEHIRFTLRDLLDFCTNPEYTAPDWPKDYWPEAAAPPSKEAWDAAVQAIHEDVGAFEKLIGDPGSNLYAEIPWGDGQTLLREVLLAGDHTSYHLGQLMMLKKQLAD